MANGARQSIDPRFLSVAPPPDELAFYQALTSAPDEMALFQSAAGQQSIPPPQTSQYGGLDLVSRAYRGDPLAAATLAAEPGADPAKGLAGPVGAGGDIALPRAAPQVPLGPAFSRSTTSSYSRRRNILPGEEMKIRGELAKEQGELTVKRAEGRAKLTREQAFTREQGHARADFAEHAGQARIAEVEAEEAKEQERLAGIRKKISDFKPDSNRYYSNLSTGAKIAHGIASLASGVLLGLGVDPGISALDREISTDLELQFKDLDKMTLEGKESRGILGDLYREIGDEKQAIIQAKKMAWDSVAQQFKTMALHAEGPDQLLAAQMGQNAALEKANEANIASKTISVTSGGTTRKTPIRRTPASGTPSGLPMPPDKQIERFRQRDGFRRKVMEMARMGARLNAAHIAKLDIGSLRDEYDAKREQLTTEIAKAAGEDKISDQDAKRFRGSTPSAKAWIMGRDVSAVRMIIRGLRGSLKDDRSEAKIYKGKYDYSSVMQGRSNIDPALLFKKHPHLLRQAMGQLAKE